MSAIPPRPGPPALLRFEIEPVPGAAVLRLRGRMDAEGVREIQDRFDAASDGSVPILVDLSGITFMDSLGVALLVRLAKRLKSFSVPMAVIPGPGPVARILGLARIDKILNVVFTREDAWTVLRLSPPA